MGTADTSAPSAGPRAAGRRTRGAMDAGRARRFADFPGRAACSSTLSADFPSRVNSRTRKKSEKKTDFHKIRGGLGKLLKLWTKFIGLPNGLEAQRRRRKTAASLRLLRSPEFQRSESPALSPRIPELHPPKKSPMNFSRNPQDFHNLPRKI